MKLWLLGTDAAIAVGLRLLILLVVAWPASAADQGAVLYDRHCAACHGNNGMGGVGVPLALADFLAVADDHYLRTTIRRGRPGRVMPAFTQLREEDVSALVQHIRSWKKPQAKSQALIPARRGIVCATLRRLSRRPGSGWAWHWRYVLASARLSDFGAGA